MFAMLHGYTAAADAATPPLLFDFAAMPVDIADISVLIIDAALRFQPLSLSLRYVVTEYNGYDTY